MNTIKQRGKLIQTKVTLEEEELIKNAADSDGRSVSSFVRYAALKEARQRVNKINDR